MSLNVSFRTSLIEGRDPADFLLDADPAPPCALGHPPRAFQPIHRSRFVNRWLQRIRACLADPVETEWVDGLTRINFETPTCSTQQYVAARRLPIQSSATSGANHDR